MGVCVYSLKSSNPLRTPDGPVYRYTYLHKCTWNGDAANQQERTLARITERFRLEGPVFVFDDFGAGHREGMGVYFQAEPSVYYYDTEAIPGILVGFLRKRGGRWHISTLGEEVERSMRVLRGYADRYGLQVEQMEEDAWHVLRRLSSKPSVVSGNLQALHESCRDHFRKQHTDAHGTLILLDPAVAATWDEIQQAEIVNIKGGA